MACTPARAGPCCPLQGRLGALLWALLLGAAVYIQWPMIKGAYKATGAQALASAVAWHTGGLDAALAESAKWRSLRTSRLRPARYRDSAAVVASRQTPWTTFGRGGEDRNPGAAASSIGASTYGLTTPP